MFSLHPAILIAALSIAVFCYPLWALARLAESIERRKAAARAFLMQQQAEALAAQRILDQEERARTKAKNRRAARSKAA